MRAAVACADEYNTLFPTLEDAREHRRLLDEAARAAGRHPLRVSMTAGCVVGRDEAETSDRRAAWRDRTGRTGESPQLCGTVEEIVERLRAYEQAGIGRAMLQHLVHEDVEMVGVLGEVAAGLR